MTWLFLIALAAICVYLLTHDTGPTDQPTVRRGYRTMTVPRVDGLVHYHGFAGRSILLESPRGVELELDADAWRTDTDAWILDDVLTTLAEIDLL
jgi:hypothetical protein